jgi:hypothetical protein
VGWAGVIGDGLRSLDVGCNTCKGLHIKWTVEQLNSHALAPPNYDYATARRISRIGLSTVLLSVSY